MVKLKSKHRRGSCDESESFVVHGRLIEEAAAGLRTVETTFNGDPSMRGMKNRLVTGGNNMKKDA